ncbi:MAG: hypothetical protein ABIJ92_04410 [Candidatus Aenigmatarchaeota archaeon]
MMITPRLVLMFIFGLIAIYGLFAALSPERYIIPLVSGEFAQIIGFIIFIIAGYFFVRFR